MQSDTDVFAAASRTRGRSEGRQARARRKNVPLDVERQCDGLRENGRRNSEVRRGCGETGKIRREQIVTLFLPLSVPLLLQTEGERSSRRSGIGKSRCLMS